MGSPDFSSIRASVQVAFGRLALTAIYAGLVTFSKIALSDGQDSLSFDCGSLPVDETAIAAERNPNGYFWEGVVTFGFPQLVQDLELDSEAGCLLRTEAESCCSNFSST